MPRPGPSPTYDFGELSHTSRKQFNRGVEGLDGGFPIYLQMGKLPDSLMDRSPKLPRKLALHAKASTCPFLKVVKVTASCGAIRHGAECFNFYFPQDLQSR